MISSQTPAITGTQQNWYTNAYGSSFRTSRLRAPSLLPPHRLHAHAHPLPVQQTLVIDAVRHNPPAGEHKEGEHQVRRETIFGPDVGEDDEPGWTPNDEGARVDVDVVKGWVDKAKSEEGSHATTTLQALVNLKRPSLLLQHVEPDGERRSIDGESGDITPVNNNSRVSIPSVVPQQPLHLLKFNYDATTPMVNINLSIYPAPPPPIENPDGKSIPSLAEEEPKLVYAGLHKGGFNQLFNLPPDAAIDLSSAIAPHPSIAGGEAGFTDISLADKGALPADRISHSEDTNRSSVERGMTNLNISGTATPNEVAAEPVVSSGLPANARQNNANRRRFGMFSRRNRETDAEQGGIEMQNQDGEGEGGGEKEPERGLRLLIRIEGVGPEGQPLKRRNAQLTHILISGMWAADTSVTTTPVSGGKQVWVVKVVRREAIIGAHTFLLKEIFGLSSANQPAEPPSYPPQAGVEADPYSSAPNECIVCLTAPRDVVLLPCRHLVVCRDCAVGMVEFGAGGKVARREDAEDAAAAAPGGAPTSPTAATTGGANGATAAAAAPAVAAGTTTTGRDRRKKKAKGWYCPVCRQPYTSLLRLALPSSNKPDTTNELARVPSRAQSMRSVRTVNTIPPTLPSGAEKMLEALRPKGADDDDSDDGEPAEQSSRPQFEIGEEDKDEPDHQETPRSPVDPSKGWKEASTA